MRLSAFGTTPGHGKAAPSAGHDTNIDIYIYTYTLVSASCSVRVIQVAGGNRISRTEKTPKENLHKEFRRDPGRGGRGGGLGAQILYVGVGFSQQNTVHKEFRGGGLRGSWGWGLRSNFGAPFLYVYVLFWGLRISRTPSPGTLYTFLFRQFRCNPARPLQESPGPSGPGIPKESQKSLPGPSGPGVQKMSETVSGVSKQSILRLRRLF